MNTRKHHHQSDFTWVGKFATFFFLSALLLASCSPATSAPVVTQPIQPSATTLPPTTAPTETQAPTATATATLVPTPADTPTPASSPTFTPTPTPQPVELTDWKASNFEQIASGCTILDAPCWQTITTKVKQKGNDTFSGESKAIGGTGTVVRTSESSLTSQTSLLIDPAWKNPYLVYLYDNQVNGEISVIVKVDKGSEKSAWETLARYSFRGQSQASVKWAQGSLDLSKYKGQKIIISFYANITLPQSQAGSLPSVNKWHLQNIQIVPDYTVTP